MGNELSCDVCDGPEPEYTEAVVGSPEQARVSVDELEDIEDTRAPLEKRRLILISDSLECPNTLLEAVRADVIGVAVRYSEWSLYQLYQAIKTAAGEPNHQLDSVSLIDHGSPGRLHLLSSVANGSVNLREIQTNKELHKFLVFLAGYVARPEDPRQWRADQKHRIDLMACNEAQEGKELITLLEDLTEVHWAPVAVENIFVMDSKAGLGAIPAMYFQDDQLGRWQSAVRAKRDSEARQRQGKAPPSPASWDTGSSVGEYVYGLAGQVSKVQSEAAQTREPLALARQASRQIAQWTELFATTVEVLGTLHKAGRLCQVAGAVTGAIPGYGAVAERLDALLEFPLISLSVILITVDTAQKALQPLQPLSAQASCNIGAVGELCAWLGQHHIDAQGLTSDLQQHTENAAPLEAKAKKRLRQATESAQHSLEMLRAVAQSAELVNEYVALFHNAIQPLEYLGEICQAMDSAMKPIRVELEIVERNQTRLLEASRGPSVVHAVESFVQNVDGAVENVMTAVGLHALLDELERAVNPLSGVCDKIKDEVERALQSVEERLSKPLDRLVGTTVSDGISKTLRLVPTGSLEDLNNDELIEEDVGVGVEWRVEGGLDMAAQELPEDPPRAAATAAAVPAAAAAQKATPFPLLPPQRLALPAPPRLPALPAPPAHGLGASSSSARAVTVVGR